MRIEEPEEGIKHLWVGLTQEELKLLQEGFWSVSNAKNPWAAGSEWPKSGIAVTISMCNRLTRET